MLKRGLGALIGIIVLLALATTTGLAAPAGDYVYEGYIYYGDTVYGDVTTEEGDIWYLDGTAGEVVNISMLSSDVDGMLYLWFSGSSVEFITSNDDYGGGRDPFIEAFTLPYTGQYMINADGYNDQTGAYSLYVWLGGEATSHSVDIVPDDLFDMSDLGGCPEGIYCLRNESFRWDTDFISYCVAPDAGYWITVGGHNFPIYGGTVTNTNLWDMAVEATDYWQLETGNGFGFGGVIDCDNADIIIGWADIADIQASEGGANVHPLGYSIAIRDNPKQFAIVMNMSDFNWDRNASAMNWDAANTLAHEMGHSMGIGHDEAQNTLMYPSNGSTARLSGAVLGEDARSQLATTYPAYIPWASTRTGFNIDRFEALNGQEAYISVPYPDGANNVYAICAIEAYVPFDDDGQDKDMGWNCNVQVDSVGRQVFFTLTPYYSDAGSIIAKALVVDNDVFQLVQSYYFQAWSEGTHDGVITIHPTSFTDLFYGGTYDTIDLYSVPANSIPIMTVTTYDTSDDDDFSFGLTADPANGYYDMLGWDGNGSSYVAGYLAIMVPVDPNARAAYCFANGYNDQAVSLSFPDANCSSSYIDPNMNTAVFSSLITLSNDTHDLYGTLLTMSTEDLGGGGIQLSGYLWNANGGDGSSSSFEVVILQMPW